MRFHSFTVGSPPKDIIATYANRFSSNTELDNSEDNKVEANFNDADVMEDSAEASLGNKPIPSIFDLNLKPTAELQERLDAGLYDEITAPISDGDEDDPYSRSPVKM